MDGYNKTMKKLFIILLSVLSLTAFAQQKVAVYVTGQESGIKKVLGDQLVAAFAKSGKYMAIERTASFLAEMKREQNYQATGVVDDNELSRLGKQFGVQMLYGKLPMTEKRSGKIFSSFSRRKSACRSFPCMPAKCVRR